MINSTNNIARRAVMATAATLLAAVGLTIATAATASADPLEIAYATSPTLVTDKPGGGTWVTVLDKGQPVLLGAGCQPGVSTPCQVYDASLPKINGKWVDSKMLSFQPQGPVQHSNSSGPSIGSIFNGSNFF